MSDIIDIRKTTDSHNRRKIYKNINSRCKDLPRSKNTVAQEFIAICNQSDLNFRAKVAGWASKDALDYRHNEQCLEVVEKLLNAIDIIEKRDSTIKGMKEAYRLVMTKLCLERMENIELKKKAESRKEA